MEKRQVVILFAEYMCDKITVDNLKKGGYTHVHNLGK